MKLLHVINSADPKGGGPIEAIIQSHLALQPQGHEMEIACVDTPGEPWLERMPLRTHALGPAGGKYRRARKLKPWLREHAPRFDAVIVHGIWLYPSYAVYRALDASTTPYFVYTHGMMDPTFRKLFPLKHMYKSICWRLREHRIMEHARAVFFTCEEEKRLAEASFKPFKHNAAIVPYCVGEPPGDPDAQKMMFFRQYPDLKNKRLVVFLSRIHKKKGCDLLIEAFAKSSSKDADVHLVMAGPDSMGWRSALETRARELDIEERVTWTGMLEGDMKWGALRAAEAFVLPSHQENFGIAVVEALACGVPVLITDKINIWREILEDQAGIVGQDHQQSIDQLVSSWVVLPREKRQEMRRCATRCFAKRFSSDESARNLLAVLKRYRVEHVGQA